MRSILARLPIITFLVITFALSSIFYFLILNTGKLGSGFGLYITGLMWCPGIFAIITSLILRRKMSKLGWQWGKSKYQLRSYLIPILYSFIAYIIIWSSGWGSLYNKEFVIEVSKSFGWTQLPSGLVIILFFIITGIFGISGKATTALGEEIGWRGFLVPELSKSYNYTKTSLIAGVIWGFWHFPPLLFADYNGGTPALFGLSCFMVGIISVSFILSWFRLKSNSLWRV